MSSVPPCVGFLRHPAIWCSRTSMAISATRPSDFFPSAALTTATFLQTAYRGTAEWDGFIPFDELPSAFNPPSGVIVSANQNPFPADYKYRGRRRIRTALSLPADSQSFDKGPHSTAEDTLAIQKDVYSGRFHDLLHSRRWARSTSVALRTPSLQAGADILRKWNGQMDKDESAPLIASLMYQQLRRAIGDRASNGKGDLWEVRMGGACHRTHSATASGRVVPRLRPTAIAMLR